MELELQLNSKCNSSAVMRLKIQELSELNFVSRIIQFRLIGIGNCHASAGQKCCQCRARSPERAENRGLFGEQPLHNRYQ